MVIMNDFLLTIPLFPPQISHIILAYKYLTQSKYGNKTGADTRAMEFGDVLQFKKCGFEYIVRHSLINWPLSRGCFGILDEFKSQFCFGKVQL